MRLPELELVSPETVAEACRYLEAGSEAAQAIAGGTDLLMALKDGQKHPGMLVDLNGIAGLDGLEFSPRSGLEIGALVTLRRLAGHPAVQSHYPVLVKAASRMGTLQLQEMGTVAGNLCQDSCCLYFNRSEDVRRPLPPCHKLGGCVCHVVKDSEECWAPYAGDMAPVLMVLGATVTVAGRKGEAVRPVAAIFSDDGVRPLDLEPGRLVTGIHCPAPSRHSGAAYFKLRPRESLDFAVLGVAVSLTLNPRDMSCADAAVVLTGVGSSPVTVGEARDLIGASVGDAGIERVAKAAMKIVHPVKNVSGAQPGYRRRMVKVFVEQGLRDSLRTAMAASSGDIQ
jgi:4-hydroxybenzoyl-CoA reductase subunit beta